MLSELFPLSIKNEDSEILSKQINSSSTIPEFKDITLNNGLFVSPLLLIDIDILPVPILISFSNAQYSSLLELVLVTFSGVPAIDLFPQTIVFSKIQLFVPPPKFLTTEQFIKVELYEPKPVLLKIEQLTKLEFTDDLPLLYKLHIVDKLFYEHFKNLNIF